MFGWEGWSLSVPRPGKRVRSELSDAPGGGTRITEVAEPTPTTPTGDETHPFVFGHTFAKGTLPRLRYGRDYAFRAWAVDLAGGVRAHHVGPRPPARLDAVGEAAALSPFSDRRAVPAGRRRQRARRAATSRRPSWRACRPRRVRLRVLRAPPPMRSSAPSTPTTLPMSLRHSPDDESRRTGASQRTRARRLGLRSRSPRSSPSAPATASSTS